MQILLTNDDGIYAQGLAEMHRELCKIGQVDVVAPQTEQSGVSHTITFLRPLSCEVVVGAHGVKGWCVDGAPADCVKLAVSELCDKRPDLVVSGINHGLNAGINVIYSGTVAGAMEAAFFGIPSVAVSLERREGANFKRAAAIARALIEQLLRHGDGAQVYNINIPVVATQQPFDIEVVPMGTQRFGQDFISGQDPNGRTYYWAAGIPDPPPLEHDTDVMALKRGCVTLTPLKYDRTDREIMQRMSARSFDIDASTV